MSAPMQQWRLSVSSDRSGFVGTSAVFGVVKFVGATPEGKVRQYCGHFCDWRDGLAGPVAAD